MDPLKTFIFKNTSVTIAYVLRLFYLKCQKNNFP